MTTTGTEASPWNGYATQELIVSTLHIDAVVQILDAIGVGRSGEADRSEELGLARLTLTDMRRGLGAVYGGTTALPAAKAGATAKATDSMRALMAEAEDEVTDLDLLMHFLRKWFAAAYGGWTPTIGKNRYVSNIHPFGGEVSAGGEPGDLRFLPGGEPALITDGAAGRGVRVGVLDARLVAHSELLGRYVAEPGGAHRLADLPAGPGLGHAAFVAGVVLQRAPGTDIQAHQVLGDDSNTATAWDVARTMVAFAGSGVSVLNMSFGCTTRDGQPPLVLTRAVDLLTPEVVLVAAAGNHGAEDTRASAAPVYPAAFDDVIAVGAHTGDGTSAPFSPTLPWVDLVAPGVQVTSTYPVRSAGGPGYDGQATWSGTSFATAHVTGVIAAHTEPGRIGARQALQRLMDLKPGEEYCGVRRFFIASS